MLDELSLILREKKELEAREKALKEKLLTYMSSDGLIALDNEFIKVSYVGPQKRKSIDTTLLKKMDPELFNDLMHAYPKETSTKASLRVTLRD